MSVSGVLSCLHSVSVRIIKNTTCRRDEALWMQVLGKYGIICVEDLIHEIYTVGPHFKQASNFLWPVKLSAPRGMPPKPTPPCHAAFAPQYIGAVRYFCCRQGLRTWQPPDLWPCHLKRVM